MATRIGLAGVVAGVLALAGCGGGAQAPAFGTVDPGFSGGAGLDVGGFGTGTLGGGTLPGTAIADTVRFAVDQSTLSPEAIATLDAQIGWLLQNPVPVEIEGHADERGTEQYNIQLGARRASAVRDYMVSRGIPDSRVRTNTFGRARPVATCPDESCWSQNRRAVTVVVAGPGV